MLYQVFPDNLIQIQTNIVLFSNILIHLVLIETMNSSTKPRGKEEPILSSK